MAYWWCCRPDFLSDSRIFSLPDGKNSLVKCALSFIRQKETLTHRVTVAKKIGVCGGTLYVSQKEAYPKTKNTYFWLAKFEGGNKFLEISTKSKNWLLIWCDFEIFEYYITKLSACNFFETH